MSISGQYRVFYYKKKLNKNNASSTIARYLGAHDIFSKVFLHLFRFSSDQEWVRGVSTYILHINKILELILASTDKQTHIYYNDGHAYAANGSRWNLLHKLRIIEYNITDTYHTHVCHTFKQQKHNPQLVQHRYWLFTLITHNESLTIWIAVSISLLISHNQ